MLKEFKEFLIKGNMVDMAVGFIFGAAFATLIKSLVANVIMPPVGLLLGNVDFSQLFIALDGKTYETMAKLTEAGAPAIKLGLFMNDTISFVILGFVMFMFIKSYNKMQKKEEEVPAEPTTKVCGDCAMEIPIAAKKCAHCGNTEV
ncbi:large conductance mechanosensitive channel protein MscL [Poseidonibacter ostreae]|jgi:large conductance mechanosensitive channel|uniref:Large-conductance mechanosensitive channel n=1 Tax=Poseidonibacter ostreae TaxID=2654171 RepID=A0ABQ6VKS6_9BACT|nr:large conductance mechanosensitive channel protein MscL [Poseidonibacter ostreae]KAB7885383.1 large conductance mechanosensitive channel protein MscL [Poseidonibacter ostreae]KAB7890585.1 large conductance mechanosensitive channel protein MscL [Poseidonibacter ostreae]MAC82992.1 large conductance mechanosensitive channel protein MscL [Arcobacter sp.]|tara:strand:+ start:4427 stop:4864 length:438 start_codon:yes stop_codon:yes gene_type:complete